MELQIITLIIEGLVGALISYFGWKIKQHYELEKQRAEEIKKFKDLELRNTRMILIREMHHYLDDKGFAPLYALSAVVDSYKLYHELGGNGGIETLYQQFLKLPHKERKK